MYPNWLKLVPNESCKSQSECFISVQNSYANLNFFMTFASVCFDGESSTNGLWDIYCTRLSGCGKVDTRWSGSNTLIYDFYVMLLRPTKYRRFTQKKTWLQNDIIQNIVRIETLLGQWLWLSWQSRCFKFQRSTVRIQSWAKSYVEHLLSTVLKRRK